jgi:hypothetical protein
MSREYYTDYELTKWGRIAKIRDSVDYKIPGEERIIRVGVCLMCKGMFKISCLQVHHVWPKAIYPQRALDLRNAIVLCTGCHLGVVHAGNSFKDIVEQGNWRFFARSFSGYTCSRENREFAKLWQNKVYAKWRIQESETLLGA